MKQALLTGGLGFIGRTLARRLVADGWAVRAFDNLNPQVHADPAAALAEFPGDAGVGDIRDEPALEEAVRGCDLVVHLAAETGVGQSMYESDRYESTNVEGSAIVGRVARRSHLPLIFFSSRAVYGEGTYECRSCGVTYGQRCCEHALPRCSTEHDPLAPTSVYGETKARAEAAIVAGWPRDLPLLILRPQNVIGPGQSLSNPYTGVLAAFVARLGAGLSLQVFGDGSQTRDIVHVEDVVSVVAWAVTAPAVARPTVMNVGSGRRTTLVELARCVLRAGADASVGIEFVDIARPGDIEHACADMTVAARAGAPAARRSLDAAVGDFLTWAQRQPPAAPQLWDHALQELADKGLL